MVNIMELQSVEERLSEKILYTRELVLESYKDVGLYREYDYKEFFKELESRYLNA